MCSQEFSVTGLNRVKQVGQRGSYDHEAVFEILDACLVGNVGFASEGQPFVIPMLYARENDVLFFHGSTKSRLMSVLSGGDPVCLSVTILDGLVFARSLFHHSMNYQSVTVFGNGFEVTDCQSRLDALKLISDKVMPGRWEDARQPSDKEMKATRVAALKISTASAKVRAGDPVDDAEDLDLDVWAGVVPMQTVAGSPVDAKPPTGIPVPGYVQEWREDRNRENTGNE